MKITRKQFAQLINEDVSAVALSPLKGLGKPFVEAYPSSEGKKEKAKLTILMKNSEVQGNLGPGGTNLIVLYMNELSDEQYSGTVGQIFRIMEQKVIDAGLNPHGDWLWGSVGSPMHKVCTGEGCPDEPMFNVWLPMKGDADHDGRFDNPDEYEQASRDEIRSTIRNTPMPENVIRLTRKQLRKLINEGTSFSDCDNRLAQEPSDITYDSMSPGEAMGSMPTADDECYPAYREKYGGKDWWEEPGPGQSEDMGSPIMEETEKVSIDRLRNLIRAALN